MCIGASVSLVILVACLIVWLLAAIQNLRLSKNVFVLLVVTTLISIVGFAYFFEVNGDKLDLSRHYELLDQMKMGGWHFAQEESQYAPMFVYNTFAYSVAQNGNYALLQTIPLIIDFSVFLYIYLDIFKRNRANSSTISAKDSLFIFFLWISLFGIKLAITGIRCVLAVALCSLAIYQEYICKKNRSFSLLLYILALFIHSFTMWVIIIRLLTIFKKKIIIASVFFVALLSGETVFQFLYNNVSNEYIRFACTRVLETFSGFQFSNERIQNSGTAFIMMWGGFVLITACLIYMSNYAKKYYLKTVTLGEKENKYCLRLFEFCHTVGWLGLPMAFNYLYMERYMYLVAWALLMIGYYYLKTVTAQRMQSEKNSLFMLGMTSVCLFVVFFNDIYQLMVNYVGVYFLAM